MQGRKIKAGFTAALMGRLTEKGRVLGPVPGADGVVRLLPVTSWSEVASGSLPRISLKKVVFPTGRELWRWLDGVFEPTPEDALPLALVGIAPCDLYGLAYLDRVFAEDERYLSRRRNLLLVAGECTPDECCSCPPQDQSPPFDLFLTSGAVWVGSNAGERLLDALASQLEGATDAPLPTGLVAAAGKAPLNNLEEIFLASEEADLWQREAQRCLSCGACSAVCPTCYCYDAVDTALPDGSVSRSLAWDNCFFREHALVAGGHDFRAGRKSRLRFRFEHKYLGFGALKGVNSCVGCGRCRRACPVDISIGAIAEELAGGETR